MSKEEAIKLAESLKDCLAEVMSNILILQVAKKTIKIDTQERKNRTKNLESAVKSACRIWFDDLQPLLVSFKLNSTLIQKYDGAFSNLIHKLPLLTIDTNQGGEAFRTALGINMELIPTIYTYQETQATLRPLEEMLETATISERDYLVESLGCFRYGFYRASIVLGWSAAIHRIHKVLMENDIQRFNDASSEMKKLKRGRFGRFNKEFEIETLNELSASVFDTDLLWVVEYLQLIDRNQHKRLAACYSLRCDAAHPSIVTIKVENLASFFSDLNEVVFKNISFTLES